MDHLKEAQRAMEHIHASDVTWDKTRPAERAIAHALVALVERLDRLTETDIHDRGFLRVDA